MDNPPSYDEAIKLGPGTQNATTQPIAPIQIPPTSPGNAQSRTTSGTQPVVVVIQQPQLNSGPTRIVCPYCRVDSKTRIESKVGLRAKLLSLLVCLVLFPVCCCCLGAVPAVFLQHKKHYCSSCSTYIGEFDPYVHYYRRF